MDIIFSEVGVDSAFEDMRMLGGSLMCNSNKFLKEYCFKDAAYNNCVKKFSNFFQENDAVAAAIAHVLKWWQIFQSLKIDLE